MKKIASFIYLAVHYIGVFYIGVFFALAFEYGFQREFIIGMIVSIIIAVSYKYVYNRIRRGSVIMKRVHLGDPRPKEIPEEIWDSIQADLASKEETEDVGGN